MKRIILFATIALLQMVAVAQTVVVPNKFAFLKSDNEYQLNILTKFLIEKQGFKAYMENEVPAELLNTPCNILKADVKNESNMMTSKLRLVLTDCANKEVFSSEVGKSREKEYKKSYQEALRNALAGNALATFRKQYQQPQQPQSSQPSQSSVNETPEEDSIYQLNAKKVGDLYELRWRHNDELFLKARKTITPDLYIAYEVANHKFGIVQKDGSTFYRITLYTEIEGKGTAVLASIKFIE
ncbi:hypothetical protein [Capnocytophaga leadbetteri]|uniref:hypothetical protein n=1 Tax=Capnocytophaga leadbetteri TaxID=327575 RepID=UPI0026F0935E|nr:hypothetical protein [Capnocytophaga leadbetteri]